MPDRRKTDRRKVDREIATVLFAAIAISYFVGVVLGFMVGMTW